MSHLVLARKWRPKKFADLVGQDSSATILQNIITSGKLHHAYLLTGTRGVGKTTIARIIAKALNCLNLNDNSEPCGICDNCLQIDCSSFVDVIEIDAASNTGVDNIRELIENASYAPTDGKHKVYIIDEVHMLSKAAFNAMLKTLEEPPAHVIFILATTDPQKVPITVLSRCLQLKLRNLQPPEISRHLAYILEQEQITAEPEALTLIANAANGSMRDALSLLDQAIAFSNRNITTTVTRQMLGVSDIQIIFDLLDTIISLNTPELVAISQKIYADGHDIINVLQQLSLLLCEISVAQLTNQSQNPQVMSYTNKISVNDTQLYFEICNLGINQLNESSSQNQYPTFIMTLIRMVAFNLGSQNEKEIILHQSNFNVKQKVEVEPHTDAIENKIKSTTEPQAKTVLQDHITKEKEEEKNEDENTYESKKNVVAEAIKSVQSILMDTQEIIPPIKTVKIDAARSFDGDWFNLVETLKTKLTHLYPLLANAKLLNFTDNTFEIVIDGRYQNNFTDKALIDLNRIFSEHFKQNTLINHSFSAKVDNTLAQKNASENEKKQLLAEQVISDDQNLNKILTQFSAKIMAGSIKPI